MVNLRPPRKLTLPLAVLIVNLGLVMGNFSMLWRVQQAQTHLQAAQAEVVKAQATLETAMRLCQDGIALSPGESCFIKITAPRPGQDL
jgi:hypothetical protein